ncbi:hypothetical protein PO909_034004 [Leuciscus waleckii]
MDEKNKKQLTENQNYVKVLAEILIVTATENTAQRGHRETTDYSKTIQNEILKCLGGMVKNNIIKEVKESQQFSIIVDETKDIQKKEQISFVLRYFYEGAVHESFIEFSEADQLDAGALSEKIICFFEKHGLEYKKNLVGQGYDGAAVMSGVRAGVQAKVREVAKHSFYVHCSAHCLNLVIVDSVKNVSDAGTFFSLLEHLYVFLSGSYVHTKWLKVQQEMFDGAPRELQRFSDTRWACRQAACRNVLDRLPAIIHVLEEIASEMHPQRAVEARGILGQLDLNFIGYLVAFKTILSESKILSDQLQSKNIDFSKAVNLINAFKDTLDDYRSEDTFGELWNNIVDRTQNKSKRVRQTTKVLQDSIIASTLGQHVSPDGKTSFRDKVYYPVIDHMKGEVERRFSKTNCDTMNGLQALNPSSPWVMMLCCWQRHMDQTLMT